MHAVTNGGPRPPFERLLPGKTCWYLHLKKPVSAAGCAVPRIQRAALVGLCRIFNCLRYRAAGLVLHRSGGEPKVLLLLFFQEKEGLPAICTSRQRRPEYRRCWRLLAAMRATTSSSPTRTSSSLARVIAV